MKLFGFSPGQDAMISDYGSHGAYALQLGEGRGEGHIYCIRIEPGGTIGPHEAGYGHSSWRWRAVAGSALATEWPGH